MHMITSNVVSQVNRDSSVGEGWIQRLADKKSFQHKIQDSLRPGVKK